MNMAQRGLLLALAAFLSGCAVTSMIPHGETGRCTSYTYYPPLGWGVALGAGVDGWRCAGMKEGDLALVGDRPGVKPTEPPKPEPPK